MALDDAEIMYNLALGLFGDYKVTEDDTTSKQAVLCIRYYSDALKETIAAHPWNFAKKDVILYEHTDRPIFGYSRKYAVPTDFVRILTVDNSIGSDVSRKQAGVPAWEVKGAYVHSDAGATPPSWSAGTKYYDGQFYSATPATWATGTAYVDGQYVTDGTLIYEVLDDHTSDTIAADILSDDLGAGVAGSTVTYEVATTHTSTTVAADIVLTYVENKGVDLDIVYVEYLFEQTDLDEWSPKAKEALSVHLASKIVVGLTGDLKKKESLINEFNGLVMPQARSIDGAEGKPRQMFQSEWLRSRQGGGSGDYFVT